MLPYAITLAVFGTLLAAFLALLAYEARAGRRAFPRARYHLDRRIGRVEYIVRHVDWGAFSADLVRTAVLRAAHDIAHGALLLVRTLERLLTRAVKALRETRTVTPVARQTISERAQSAYRYLQQAVRSARKETPSEAATSSRPPEMVP